MKGHLVWERRGQTQTVLLLLLVFLFCLAWFAQAGAYDENELPVEDMAEGTCWMDKAGFVAERHVVAAYPRVCKVSFDPSKPEKYYFAIYDHRGRRLAYIIEADTTTGKQIVIWSVDSVGT